uniref:Secreted protein n=1 Tax=Globodera rostochiensis TaxID=31243 RepID=A0A914HNU0_GLORO
MCPSVRPFITYHLKFQHPISSSFQFAKFLFFLKIVERRGTGAMPMPMMVMPAVLAASTAIMASSMAVSSMLRMTAANRRQKLYGSKFIRIGRSTTIGRARLGAAQLGAHDWAPARSVPARFGARSKPNKIGIIQKLSVC